MRGLREVGLSVVEGDVDGVFAAVVEFFVFGILHDPSKDESGSNRTDDAFSESLA